MLPTCCIFQNVIVIYIFFFRQFFFWGCVVLANIDWSVQKMLPTCCIWDLFSISHQIGWRMEGIGGGTHPGPEKRKIFQSFGCRWPATKKQFFMTQHADCYPSIEWLVNDESTGQVFEVKKLGFNLFCKNISHCCLSTSFETLYGIAVVEFGQGWRPVTFYAGNHPKGGKFCHRSFFEKKNNTLHSFFLQNFMLTSNRRIPHICHQHTSGAGVKFFSLVSENQELMRFSCKNLDLACFLV